MPFLSSKQILVTAYVVSIQDEVLIGKNNPVVLTVAAPKEVWCISSEQSKCIDTCICRLRTSKEHVKDRLDWKHTNNLVLCDL